MWPLQVLLQVRNAIDDDFIGSRWHDWRWASRFTTLQFSTSVELLLELLGGWLVSLVVFVFWKTALRIFLIFCMKLHIDKRKKLTELIFSENVWIRDFVNKVTFGPPKGGLNRDQKLDGSTSLYSCTKMKGWDIWCFYHRGRSGKCGGFCICDVRLSHLDT